ncbi:hypothetical protein SBY92_005314 [Candida maltosa Xu316]
MFLNFVSGISRSFTAKPFVANVFMQTRNKMKSHKAATNRFVKTNLGLRRKHAGVNHGNGRFSYASLRHLRGLVEVTNKGGHLKKFINRV